jgi:hypothetical protein
MMKFRLPDPVDLAIFLLICFALGAILGSIPGLS